MSTDPLVQERIRKLNEIKEKGINPYPYSYPKNTFANSLKEEYSKLKKEEKTKKKYKLAGRIMLLRNMGKAAFAHLQDESGRIQLYFREDDLGKEKYRLIRKVDIGDFIGVEGPVFKTKTGEVSIYVKNWTFLSKSIKSLPEKYHGLQDKELRYRQRYVDLVMNQNVKEVFKKRSLMIKYIREFFDKKGYIEVETPLLQTQYGGASARPFLTHINAWNMPMYLSISPELFLKRLIVGGFEKVYTICKNFRNEGVDASHNPEFTMLEAYAAYQDYNDMMKLTEECYEYVAKKVNNSTKVTHNVDGKKIVIDFKAPWPKMTMAQAIKKYVKIDVLKMDEKALKKICDSNKLEYEKNAAWGDLVLTIFELAEEHIIQPTHIYDMPKEGTPLCKRHRVDDRLNEQCEPIGLGMELGNLYSELNDPAMQEEEFRKQEEKSKSGNEEAQPTDEDFVNALKIGMPPTGGIGWGIDRMAILLTGVESIRDVILFPIMKPVEKEEKKK